MKLTFSLPDLPEAFEEEFFAGAWHPSESLQCVISPSKTKLESVNGRSWCIFSSVNPESGASLITKPPEVGEQKYLNAVAFRGYLVEPPVHTGSPRERIFSTWKSPKPPFNGSFACVRILDDSLELTADVLGISPLYYRQLGELVLFSTNPRLLCCGGDELDPLSGKALILSRFAWGNNGLTAGVKKVPPASQLSFTSTGIQQTAWFDYGSLPPGDEPITKQNLKELEDSFQTAIDRLLRLDFGKIAVPLSGGNDSRRILAAILSRKSDFIAYTVRVFHDGRDMDASFAIRLAQHFRFPQKIIELPRSSDFARLDRLRRALVDGEGIEHTWWAAMGTSFPRGTMLFDGLVGDITSYSFYDAKEATGNLDALQHILSPSSWPSARQLQQYLDDFLADVPAGLNRDTLAFLLLRTRSGPALMATRLLPIGNLAVFPFMDLDYLANSLRFMPDKKATKDTALQQRCLTEFWPEYAAFPTTRNAPEVAPLFRDVQREQWTACLRQLNSESGYPLYGRLHSGLTSRAWALALAAPFSTQVSARIRWWLEPFLTLAARQQLQRPAWTVEEVLLPN